MTIPDANLRTALAVALDKASGATITKGEMSTLEYLDAHGSGIRDLTGLEFATNLAVLLLGGNNISDIAPLAGLTNLGLLHLSGNNISDIAPLAGLTSLRFLSLGDNNLIDVSALRGLTNLEEVGLRLNPLSISSVNNHISALESRGVRVLFDLPFREGDFDIELVFLDDHFTEKQKEGLRYAARRWMSIIREDLPDYTFARSWSDRCGDRPFEIPAGERIDDLRIYVSSSDLDGNVLARGGPFLLHMRTDLPIVGCVQFWSGLAKTTSPLLFLDTGIHEIGHVLGIGTLWDDFIQNPSGDTHFTGPRAIAAFDDAGGRDYTGAKVPVEGIGHWKSPVLDGEIMNSRARGIISGRSLSAITIQALADLGWVVDVTQADPYTLPLATAKASAKVAAPATHVQPEWSCGTGQVREPIYVVDEQGNISRTLYR